MARYKFECLLRANISIEADSPAEAEAILQEHFRYEDEESQINFGYISNQQLMGSIRRAGYNNDFTHKAPPRFV